MKKIILIITLLMGGLANAELPKITEENCKTSPKLLRESIPNKNQRKTFMQSCISSAIKNKWKMRKKKSNKTMSDIKLKSK